MNWRSILKLDARLSEKMRVAEKPGALRSFAAFLAHSGDSWFWGVGLISLWASGDSFWKRWAVVQLVGVSVLAALVLCIKFLVRRRRPEGEWGTIYRSTDPHSFPSGHAARSFFIAAIGSTFGPVGVGIFLWCWAPLVAVARVAMGVHYVSDILAGAILGVIFAWFGLKVYEPIFFWLSGLIHIPLW